MPPEHPPPAARPPPPAPPTITPARPPPMQLQEAAMDFDSATVTQPAAMAQTRMPPLNQRVPATITRLLPTPMPPAAARPIPIPHKARVETPPRCPTRLPAVTAMPPPTPPPPAATAPHMGNWQRQAWSVEAPPPTPPAPTPETRK